MNSPDRPASRAPVPAAASPSLSAAARAFELKFLVGDGTARAIESWADRAMIPDPHGEPARGGAYEVTTVYLDTPALDVFHRAPETGGDKHRLRRYGGSGDLWLERKTRAGERVSKRRDRIPDVEVGWLAGAGAPAGWGPAWFLDEVEGRLLRPVAAVAYLRRAYFGASGPGRFRLTLDREIQGARASGWSVPVAGGRGCRLLAEGAVCELKFTDSLPAQFRALVSDLGLSSSGFSKYRRACVELGLAEGGTRGG
ncbi:MAG: polyphosphate polymerase domain-containing protein [Candidatus Brocadiae bacterium]|nr:polyphosphate polymerase domain-containing protein [Candidatus Brocadiia bacterium]